VQDTSLETTAVELSELQQARIEAAAADVKAAEEVAAAAVAAEPVPWTAPALDLGDVVLFGIDRRYIDSLPERDPMLTPGDVAPAMVVGLEDDGLFALRVFSSSWSSGWVRPVRCVPPPSIDAGPTHGACWVRP
jgi:hypothetical protein